MSRFRLLTQEDGFTLIELLIAATVGAMGVLATVMAIESSRSMVTLAERETVAAHQAQRELERLIARPYTTVALTAAPTAVADANHPSSHVSGSSYQYPGTPSEPFVIAPGGVAPSAPWADGASRLSGTTWRYITSYDDGAVLAAGRRVTVAVTVNGRGGPAKAVFASSIVYAGIS
jgi:prepilin-type N-terminal cleavage/methylation domain-containing protein